MLFQADPLSAEIGLRDNLFHLGRSTLSGAIESFDFGPSVEVEGKKVTTQVSHKGNTKKCGYTHDTELTKILVA